MKTFLVFFALSVLVVGALSTISGTGTTTRSWDCCKPSCAWKEQIGKAKGPVASCAKDGVSHVADSAHSGCYSNGSAYVCNNLQPWAANNTLAYGFVAAYFYGGSYDSKCCTCFKVTFTRALKGKTMIVQNVHTGLDFGANNFVLQIPGGGVGLVTRGCQTQWNASTHGWAQINGEVSSDAECSQLPKELQAGCHWRFNWYEDAVNPPMQFDQINCPLELTSRSGCENNN